MSETSKISSGTDIQDLMKILENGQAQQIDLAKKMITLNVAGQVSQKEAEGKGQIIDAKA